MRLRNLAALLLVTAPAIGLAETIDGADLEHWLARYEKAWETRDGALAGSLFTEGALYHETPYAEPFRGREAIAAYWNEVTANQRDIDFTSSVLSTEGATGIAHWTARFTLADAGVEIELDGIFVLEFEDTQTVRVLKEWWMTPPET